MFRKWCLSQIASKKVIFHISTFNSTLYTNTHQQNHACYKAGERNNIYSWNSIWNSFLFEFQHCPCHSTGQEVLLWKQRSANISNWHLHMRLENSHHMSSLNLRQISLTSWPLHTAGHWDRALPDWIPHLTTVQSTCDFIARPPKMTKFSHFERFELNTKHKNKTNNQSILYISNHKHAPALPNKPRVASSDVDDTSGLKPASLSEMKGSRNQGGFIIECPSHQIWAGAWKLNTWQIPIRWLWCKVRRWSVDSVDSVDTLNVDIVERACHSCGGICRRQPQVHTVFETSPIISHPSNDGRTADASGLFGARVRESSAEIYRSIRHNFPKIWFCSEQNQLQDTVPCHVKSCAQCPLSLSYLHLFIYAACLT